MTIQPSDLQRLIKDPSIDVRIDVTEKIATGFKNGDFGISEKKIAIEIFRILVNDIEKRVRQVLSNRLSDSLEAPHDIIFKLANDIKEVALPVLKNSYILTETDLIAITEKSDDVDIMSTIAKRETVSRELSSALVKKLNVTVTQALLQNKNANIDGKELNNIYNSYSDNTAVMESMAQRESIPIILAEKLFAAVGDEVKKILTKQYNISFQVADDSAKYARELATLGLIDEEMRGMEMEDLITHLDKNGRLSISIIIRALCSGNLRFFEYAIAKLAGIPTNNARIIVLDQGKAFESLYKKTNLPPEMFSAINYLLKAVLEETSLGRYPRNDFKYRLASRISKDNAASKIEYMDYIIMIVQNNTVDSNA